MATHKQIAASRANGRKSRGPVTPEGKLRSSRANLQHGMLARTIVLDGESRERFNALMQSLEEELQPETAIERLLVHKMVVAHWRQMRIWGFEKAGISHETGNQTGRTEAVITRDAIAFRTAGSHMSEYEMRCDRQFTRALNSFLGMRRQPRLVAQTSVCVLQQNSPGRSQQAFETKGPDVGA